MAQSKSRQPSLPLVSVVIPTRNRVDDLRRCLDSVRRENYKPKEIIVVDDASEEPVESVVGRDYPEVRFIRNEKRTFLACSRNAGASASAGEYLFFVDDDNVVHADVVRALLQPLSSSRQLAFSTPMMYYLSEPTRAWTSYIVRGRFPAFYQLRTDVPRAYRETFSFHNCFMMRKSAFDELGGFDCVNFPMRFSELDLTHRLRNAGYAGVAVPEAKVWHNIGWALVHVDSRRAYYTEKNRMVLLKRYYPKKDFRFYSICILPFLGAYYLIHHSLSTSDGRARTAAALLRGIVDGLRLAVRTTPKR